jgi:hypothetical protein
LEAAGATTEWWERRGFWAFLVVLSILPLLYPQFPPMVDLPGHIGRYKIAMGDSELLARFYRFQWHLSGNLGADLIIIPLSWLVGPEAATKFVVTLIPPLMVTALLAISRTVHGQLSPTAAMVVPLVYTQPFLYGFINYMLSATFALWALYLFYVLGRAGRMRLRAALLVPIGFILFVTHVSGWGILGLTALAVEWSRYRTMGCKPYEAAWKASLQMTPLMLPLLLLLSWQSDAAGETTDWFLWFRKISLSAMLFRDLWPAADRAAGIFLNAFVGLMLIKRLRRLDPAIGFGSLAIFGAFLLLPFVIFGSAYSDIRLLPISLMLLFVAVQPLPPEDRRIAQFLASAATAFAVVQIVAVTIAFAVAGDRLRNQLSVIDAVDRGARIAVAVGRCGYWTLPRADHLSSMAIVRKEAFVNDQWFLPGSVSLVVHYPEAGAYAHDPSQVMFEDDCGPKLLNDWMAGLPADAFDYVWLIDTVPMPRAYSPNWQLVAERPGSRLYRKLAPRQAGRVSTQP